MTMKIQNFFTERRIKIQVDDEDNKIYSRNKNYRGNNIEQKKPNRATVHSRERTKAERERLKLRLKRELEAGADRNEEKLIQYKIK